MLGTKRGDLINKAVPVSEAFSFFLVCATTFLRYTGLL